MWELSKQDVEDLATGAAILGTGGGGDPYLGKLMALSVLERGMKINVIPPKDVPDDALIIPSAAMGTPTVLIEKISKGDEVLQAFNRLRKFFGQEVYATMPLEAGGVNSVNPLTVGARCGIPIVDADGMGRAFPELQMTTFHVHGVPCTPMTLVDEKGNVVILDAVDDVWAEKLARVVTIRFGGTAWISLYPMTGKDIKRAGILHTLTLARDIGRSIREARATKSDPVDSILGITRGYRLFEGKIVDVERRTVAGFARGEAKLEGLGDYEGSELKIQFQNENLVAVWDGDIVCSVPDLISVLELETGLPITTEYLRYGYRVEVIGMPCDGKWRASEALKVVGPKYFGYDIDYVPIEKRMGGGG
ncbi:MAG: DUF917 domain-containing protein [Candidatus Bathyarchaeia archaeon]